MRSTDTDPDGLEILELPTMNWNASKEDSEHRSFYDLLDLTEEEIREENKRRLSGITMNEADRAFMVANERYLRDVADPDMLPDPPPIDWRAESRRRR